MPFTLATFVSDKFYLDKSPYMVCQFSILGFFYHFRLKPLKVNFLLLILGAWVFASCWGYYVNFFVLWLSDIYMTCVSGEQKKDSADFDVFLR